MNYNEIDFSEKVIDNKTVESYRARRKTKETLKNLGAAAGIGLIGMAVYLGSQREYDRNKSIETRIAKSPKYAITLNPGQTLSDCYVAEELTGNVARHAYMENSKLKGRKAVVSDVNGDGLVCRSQGILVKTK